MGNINFAAIFIRIEFIMLVYFVIKYGYRNITSLSM